MSDAWSSQWRRQGAWHGILPVGRLGVQAGAPGVIARAVEPAATLTVIGCEGREQAVDRYFQSRHGLTPPHSPAVAVGTGCILVWAGPSQWLALAPDPAWPQKLEPDLAGSAAVFDQTDARAVLCIGGPRVRDALAKGCPIDLHPRAFKAGSAAVTAIAHIGTLLWQLPDDTELHVAVARSMAGSFWSWLSSSAAEFGLEVATPGA